MPTINETLLRNVERIQERIATAANRAGRNPAEVKTVAVTKYVDAATTQALLEIGCYELGESRPQQLWSKYESVRGPVPPRWHLIGHLQRNKVKQTLPLVDLIHSIDSLRLMREIERQCIELNSTCSALLEVNVSKDREKHGFNPDEVADVLPEFLKFTNVKLVGLMAMSSRGATQTQAAREFRTLRELRDLLRSQHPAAKEMNELSMGMSGDFEVAITEGSTIVRIGSALYEGLDSCH